MPSHFLRTTLRVTTAVAVIALSTLASGCGSDAPTTPSGSNNSLDLATVFKQMSSADASSLAGARALVGIPAAPAMPAVLPSSCSFSSSTQGFVCPSTAAGGLTVGFTYFLYDAAGHTQNAADVQTTDGVRAVADVNGSVTSQVNTLNGTLLIDNHADVTLKGLLSTMRTLNGTSTSHLDLTTTGSSHSHSTADITSTTANVLLPAASGSWPASGTITSDVATKTDIGSSSLVLNVHQVITFNGTSIVTVVTTFADHTSTCKLDLSGKTAPAC